MMTHAPSPKRRIRTSAAATATAFAIATGVGIGPISLAPQASAAALCASDTEISWGIKESFRSYIKGSIANGDWTTSGNASDAGSTFVFSGSGESVDPDVQTGSITTDGSINFTGHKGILDMTISNPKIEFDTTTGTLSATVTSNDTEGNPTEYGEVVLGDLTLTELNLSSDSVSGNASVALTDTGSKAFADFYEPGTELDTVSFSGSLANGDCAAPSSSGSSSSSSDSASNSESSSSESSSKGSRSSSNSGKSNGTSDKNPRAKKADPLASTGGEAAVASDARLEFQDEAAENNAVEEANVENTAAAEGAGQLTPAQFGTLTATLIAVAGGCTYVAGRRQRN